MLEPTNIPSLDKRAVIAAAMRQLQFRRIGSLLYGQHDDDEIKEVEEFTPNTGLLVSTKPLPVTEVGGNRVANQHEIWLHRDGSLHKYLWTATWATFEYGCSQRDYVGPVSNDDVSLEELTEAFEWNIFEARQQDDTDEELEQPF
jgi:hypothetical protein